MWTRKELKERGKEALKRNYWKVILVTVFLIMIGGHAAHKKLCIIAVSVRIAVSDACRYSGKYRS